MDKQILNLIDRNNKNKNIPQKKKESFDDSLEMYGLILGLVANGMEPGDRLYTKTINSYFMFSENENLDGITLAKIVELGLYVKDRIKELDVNDLHIPDKNTKASIRLRGLQELSQGLAYGLCIKSSDGSFIESKNHPFLDEINTIYEITKIDVDDDLEEDDLNEVLKYLVSTLRKIANR